MSPQLAAQTDGGRDRPVCVITTDNDIAADRVVLALADLGVPVVRFDLAAFPINLNLDARLEDGRWTGTLHVRDHTVVLEDVRAILWWHPGGPQVQPGLTAAEERWSRDEASAGLVGVLSALDCLHLNHPARTWTSQLKADALAHAARLGLRVPRTWIGNSPAGARAFAGSSPGGVVGKSLVRPTIRDDDSRAFYTKPVTKERLDASVALTAHQLQDAAEKAFEVRLVVVDDEMFAVRIDAHSDAARADFRADYPALTYSRAEVPADVHKGVLRLMGHYGLLYAALDLVVDGENRWSLLDLNGAGQYDWLQAEVADLDISGAIAQLLASADR